MRQGTPSPVYVNGESEGGPTACSVIIVFVFRHIHTRCVLFGGTPFLGGFKGTPQLNTNLGFPTQRHTHTGWQVLFAVSEAR